MVLSTTSRTSSISSIVNQSQGGGSKKAGLAPSARTSSTNIAFALRGYQKTVARMADTANSSAGSAPVCASRSVGMLINVGRMKC